MNENTCIPHISMGLNYLLFMNKSACIFSFLSHSSYFLNYSSTCTCTPEQRLDFPTIPRSVRGYNLGKDVIVDGVRIRIWMRKKRAHNIYVSRIKTSMGQWGVTVIVPRIGVNTFFLEQ